jgi:hypothetical protein
MLLVMMLEELVSAAFDDINDAFALESFCFFSRHSTLLLNIFFAIPNIAF